MNLVQIIGLALEVIPIAFLILWKFFSDLPREIIETFRTGSTEDKYRVVSALITIIGMITATVGSVMYE